MSSNKQSHYMATEKRDYELVTLGSLARVLGVMPISSIMNKLLIGIALAIVLSSCGTLRISEDDKRLVREGKKSVLVTENTEPLYYFLVVPYILSKMAGGPIQVDIKEIDGQDIESAFKANQEIALEPGRHEIKASYNVRSGSKLAPEPREGTLSINFLFEGGKKYRISLVEYLDHYELSIEPR